jgi:hypothetical protein
MQSLFASQPMPASSDRDALLRVIRSVRNRWRLRVALRGLAILLAIGLAIFLISAFGLDRLRFTPTAVLVFRIFAYTSAAAVAVRYLFLPLLRRVAAERVALYLEEHEPTLQGQVVSAVEFGCDDADTEPSVHSPRLIQRLVERAIESCAAIDYGRRVEQPRLARTSGALVGVTLVSALVLLLRPGFIGHSAAFLLTPWSTGLGDSPYHIAVVPGDATLPRGADLKVTAELQNFDAEIVEIALRGGDVEQWERWPMTVDDDTGALTFLVFNVAEDTEYLIEAAGVRSSVFRVEVRDLPYVDRIDLKYHFPAYTGLEPQRHEDGGDIAALAGTRVVMTVVATMPVEGGTLVIDDRDTIPLELIGDALLAGELEVRQEGLYHVVLPGPGGEGVVASPDYYIDVLEDQPPAVRFTKPGRDIKVTNIDEVFLEVEAEDDYGIDRVELVYSVNGGPERSVRLHGRRPRKQVTAGHTFYLEEIELQPGDFLSYFARARDANAVGGRQLATTDIYFMEIRPFDQRYRQAESQGGQRGDGGPNVGELSTRQRQIVAATFKIVRDSNQYADEEIRENLATLALAQGRLREEVQTLVDRIQARRVVELDSTFQTVAEALPLAVREMESSEQRLGERKPQEALGPEQRALQYLQRAEAAFRERMVTQGGNQQGGGGQSASAEELADLFDLELDKLRNQYESVDRGERQQANQQVDEVLEKLRELARRQQQENERMRAGAQNPNATAGGGNSNSQRRLAEEAEQAARQLERLSREQSRPELEESARRIRDAVNAMRRAASEGADGTARGQSALDQLREARRQLERNRSASLEREIRDALQRAERLAEQQQDVVDDVERLDANPSARDERLRRLLDRKNAMAEEVEDLESQLTELGRDAREEQPEAAEKIQDAARGMRDARLADKIRFSRGVVQGRSGEYARNFEEQIETDLAQLEQGIRDALGSVGESREQRLSRTLDRTRDLVNALESLGERMRANAEQGELKEDRRLQQRADEGEQQQGAESARQGQGGEPRGTPGGPPRGGTPGQITPDAERQFGRELNERRSELAELRRELQREGVDISRLDEVMRTLGAMDNRGPMGDARGLAELESAVIASLKEFEYALRRQIAGAEGERLFLSGSDDVPVEYRELVEEYYRSLSRNRR